MPPPAPDPAVEVEALLARLERVDAGLQAFLPEPGRRGRLLAEAGGEPRRGPTVGVKDILRVDGLETRAGSALPAEVFAGPEAACVTRLREAGAWIVGKTHTAEFAMLDPGPTRNPHDPERTPGGSSSGSAAAVAAGLVDVALGTQTVGSVIRPAAYCGTVGFKPSYGRISTEGVLLCAPSIDTVGLFARDVATTAAAAALVCGGWTPAAEAGAPALGVPDGPYLDGLEPGPRAEFEARVELLAQAGLRVERVACLDDIAELGRRHSELVAHEFAREHRERFDRFGDLYRPCARGLMERGPGIGDAAADAARQSGLELRARLEDLLARRDLDLWVSPAAPGTAPRGLGATGSPAMNLPWTHAGLPTLALPAPRAADGLPLGLQFSGPFGRDEELLALAAALETALSAAR